MEVHSTTLPSTSMSMKAQRAPHSIPLRLNLSNEIIHGISIKGDLVVFGVLSNDPEMWTGITTNKFVVANWKTGHFRAIRPSNVQVNTLITYLLELTYQPTESVFKCLVERDQDDL